MSETRLTCAVLLADITGSTPLYETVGDTEAARRVGRCVDFMRDTVEHNAGHFVAAKGDDVLATFPSCDDALRAIETILSHMPMGGLYVHAGLHFGMVVATRDDIFGDAVNLTARLASAANPGEVLVSGDLHAALSPAEAARLRPLSALRLKGRAVPVAVFALAADTHMALTDEAPAPEDGGTTLRLRHGDRETVLHEGGTLTLGRAEDNDIVLADRWVSRKHATITLIDGRVQFSDHSSYGSFLTIGEAGEIAARRETVIVTGSGRLSLGISTANAEADIITLEMTTTAESRPTGLTR
ncbi:MAG: hypothetical protein AcusKO_14440 [Acuticoccus sp.]